MNASLRSTSEYFLNAPLTVRDIYVPLISCLGKKICNFTEHLQENENEAVV